MLYEVITYRWLEYQESLKAGKVSVLKQDGSVIIKTEYKVKKTAYLKQDITINSDGSIEIKGEILPKINIAAFGLAGEIKKSYDNARNNFV